LKQFLDGTRAKTLAAAWNGDRYALYEEKQSKRMVLATRLRLDSEEHATRFSGQYSEALERKYPDRSNLTRRPNFFSFDSPDGGVFLYCFGVECVTLEGATRRCLTGSRKRSSGRWRHNRRNGSSPRLREDRHDLWIRREQCRGK